MLKRLLITAAVAGSTLLVTGPITSQTANAASAYVPAGEQSLTVQTEVARKCKWRKRNGRWCYYCRYHGEWRREWCRHRGWDWDED
ncbi:hypothetical protein AB0C18_09745 [Nonomuraea muscovyensis]|uniref:hypothetical protein n=1 Tax=Nonomuraea muscovyensis TaxID=1124761 RepID=UPI0033E6B55B